MGYPIGGVGAPPEQILLQIKEVAIMRKATVLRKEELGVLQGCKGLIRKDEKFFLVCGQCGGPAEKKDAEKSVEENGYVICITCQRLKARINMYYKIPEHNFNYEELKGAKKPCECGMHMSWDMMRLSYYMTGISMCKVCLFKTHGAHLDHMSPEVIPFEPEVSGE